MRKQLLPFFFLAFIFNVLTVYAQPLTAICSGTNVTCNGGNNGTITVSATGGVPPITGTGVFSLGAGTYCYTVTDNVGATATCCTTVTEPCALSVSCSGTDATCYGRTDGDACASVTCGTPPYYYLWTNGATGSCITNLVAGSYCVYVTDACNATATCCIIISQPPPINITIQKTNPTCSTCNDGSISIIATGGSPGYIYSWTPNISSTANATGLSVGTYSVCVIDVNGCSSCAIVTLTSPPCSVTINPLVAAVCMGSCVTLTANATGNGPFTYQWLPSGQTTQTITVCPFVGITSYTVTVTDASNCTSTASVPVIVNPLPVITLNPPVSICSGDCVQLSAAGGFTYSWIPSTCLINPFPTFCCTTPGTYNYTVVVTDGNGCTNSATTTVIVNPLPTVQVSPPVSVCSGNCVLLSATPGFLTYSWMPSTCFNNPASSNPTFCCTVPGTYTYTVLVIDGNACTNSATTTVSVNPLPVAEASPDVTICIGHSVQLSASGGITCTWNPTSGLSSVTGCIVTSSPASTTTYTVTVTDIYGCKDTAHTTVTVDPCTNVNIISKDEGISFYPNPNNGLFYISLIRNLKAAELTIFNLMGEKVYAESLTPAKEGGEIPVHLNVAAGIYFVQVRSGEEMFVQKVVVE